MLDTAKMTSIREKAGLTQRDAAALAGMKSQQYNDIESGRKANVSVETLAKIAAALNVQPGEILKPVKGKAKGK